MESNLQKQYPSLKNTVFRASRSDHLKDEKAKNNYSGCLYSVGFEVDREISIVGLEFLGPAELDSVDYWVKAMICKEEGVSKWSNRVLDYFFGGDPWYRTVDLLPINTVHVKECRKGQNFTVPLPYPVDITPHLITQIKFELIGPDTQCLKYVGADRKNVSANSSAVPFTFLKGSRQLAAVHFTTK